MVLVGDLVRQVEQMNMTVLDPFNEQRNIESEE